jgi:hypothetical protein
MNYINHGNTILGEQVYIMVSTKPQTGDILLYRSNSLLSRLIRLFSGKWSHASIVFDSWYKNFVAEAEAKGVMPNSITDSIKGCEILVLRPKFEFDFKVLDQLVTSHLGKHRYNFFLLLFVQLVWQLSGKRWWLYHGDKGDKLKRAICGQFCAFIYHVYSGDKLFPDWVKATPQSIFESDLFDHYTLEV